MKDPILLKQILKEVEAGNVAASKSGDLTIYKYTQDCVIEDRWNAINRQCRGLIMKDDGTIVARGFSKFFNLGERSETQYENLPLNETQQITEKLDGSCGIGYYINDEWHLATPGSLESDQAIMGTLILNTQYKEAAYKYLPIDYTPVFEIIYPANRIVCDYKGEFFLALLAIFEKSGEELHSNRVDQIAEKCGFKRPNRFFNFQLNDLPFPDNMEGYVIRFENGLRIKVKSPAYLRVHRLLNYMSPKGVIELIRGREYGPTLLDLPKGIQQDFDDIRAYVQNMHDQLRIEAEDIALRIPEGDRKTKALWIQANSPNVLTGVVFALMDKKDIGDKLWRIVLEKVKDEKTKQVVTE